MHVHDEQPQLHVFTVAELLICNVTSLLECLFVYWIYA